jgi:hypothetical protein
MNNTLSSSVLIALCGLLSSPCALAQTFTAQEVQASGNATPEPEATTESKASAPKKSTTPIKPKTIITIFEQACVRTAGQSAEAVDWALAHDFEPVDSDTRGSMETLLAGEPGTVLVAPKTDGRVMLAVAFNQCSVWAERTPGPPVRAALSAMVQAQSSKGAKTQTLLDRSMERAGAWRNQMKWRYRPAGTAQDWNLNAVTTLANSPGTQVLRWSPVVARSK